MDAVTPQRSASRLKSRRSSDFRHERRFLISSRPVGRDVGRALIGWRFSRSSSSVDGALEVDGLTNGEEDAFIASTNRLYDAISGRIRNVFPVDTKNSVVCENREENASLKFVHMFILGSIQFNSFLIE